MKNWKRIIALFVCAVMLFSAEEIGMICSVFAEQIQREEKTFSQATVKDAFVDNHVVVVLNNEASLDFLQTEEIDFSEVKHKNIRNISNAKGKRIEAMIETRKNASLAERIFTSDPNAEKISGYQQVLCIELEEHSKENVLEAIALLEKREDVLYVGPDYEITSCASENEDPLYNNQWAPEVIDLPQAWDMIPSPTTILVGVLDTGIDASHPDLYGKVNPSLSCDFVTDDPRSPITDTNGHGTHVAGIIGAAADNSEGVKGTHWNVEFVSLRVLNSINRGCVTDFYDAMQYVTNTASEFIPIINFSGRWETATADDVSYLNSAIGEYLEMGGLFICGAGNELNYVKEIGNNDDNPGDENITPAFVYPAGMNFGDYEDSVIVVGASNQSDNGLWIKDEDEGSNEGKFAVDIFAPGDAILSCYPSAKCSECGYDDDDENNDNPNHEAVGYHCISGTSMATPYVTGVAALIKSVHPSKTAAEIKGLILANAETKSWLEGKCTTGGRLNAYDALYASHTFGPWTEGGSDYCSYRTCSECEFTEIVEHSFMKQFVNTCVFFTCAECGYYKEQHAQSPVHTAVDALTHQMTYPCCNTASTASHTWTSWVDLDTTYHGRNCTDCGYEQLQTHRECWNSLKEMCIACKRTGPITDVVQLQPPAEEEETQ